jgi:DNA-binding CsgD family transcriptional regulator
LNETTKNEEQIRENMQFEMEAKTRELTSMAMAIDQKNILWKNVQQKLKETLSAMPSISEQEIKSIFKIISQDNDSQQEWDTFKLHFESVHPQFFTTLSQIAPTLTQLELRQCAYIKINLAPKQVGNLLNITPDSVKKSRMRIKKKLNLSTEDNLSKFITNLKMV